LGRKGSGKTSLARWLARDMKRVVILDPLEEYAADMRARSLGDLVDALERSHRKRRFSIACTFESMDEYGDALDLCRDVGDLWIVVEELNFFVDCWSRDEPYLDLIRFGRHDGVSIVMVAQRAAEIPKLFTSQSDAIVSFRQTEPRDLDYLSKIGHVGDEGARAIAVLPQLDHRPATPAELEPYYAVFRA
jgi:DNA helicase HerA-like ATPase